MMKDCGFINASKLCINGGKELTTYNFYGVNEIDLNRNVVNSLWIFCDVIDGSYVNNVQIPLLQLVPTSKTPACHLSDSE